MRLRHQSERGDVLVVALVVLTLLAMMLVSYLMLASHQHLLNLRSQVWASEIPLAEAGIEEAMAHLNGVGATNRGANGWTLAGAHHVKQRTLGDGYYVVTISTSTIPVITATGFGRVPLQTNYTSRTVRCLTDRNRFRFAILAKDKVQLSGGSVVDSFDSSDPLHSTGGLYDPTKRLDQAAVGTISSAAGAIAAGAGLIYGDVYTGPLGTVAVDSSGGVGSSVWLANPANLGGIQPEHETHDLNVPIPDVGAPFAGGTVPNSGSVDGVAYTYVIGDGDYYLSACTLAAGQAAVVTGKARLFIEGNLTVSGSGYLRLGPGANLELYVGGPTADISGDGIVNVSGKAANFVVFGLPTLTTLNYSGTAQFIGTVHAPEADITLSGGAGAVGAFVGENVTLSGGTGVHYDQALGKGEPGASFVITSWREL